MGEGEYTKLRRRSRQCNHLRTIRRRKLGAESLCLAPRQGYFRRAIVQSGGFTQASDRKTEEEAGLKFAQRVGVDSIATLRAKPAAEIQRIAIPPPDGTSANVSRFRPYVDGYFSDHCPARRFSRGRRKYSFAADRLECQ